MYNYERTGKYETQMKKSTKDWKTFYFETIVFIVQKTQGMKRHYFLEIGTILLLCTISRPRQTSILLLAEKWAFSISKKKIDILCI